MLLYPTVDYNIDSEYIIKSKYIYVKTINFKNNWNVLLKDLNIIEYI